MAQRCSVLEELRRAPCVEGAVEILLGAENSEQLEFMISVV